MDIVSFSIKKPVTILVGIILVVLFGIISLQTLPYQLSPTVVEPVIILPMMPMTNGNRIAGRP